MVVMTSPVVTVERTIPADAATIFDVLADPAKHPLIDGSGSVREPRPDNPERLSRGAEFGMAMRLGAPYKITNKVVEFEEGRLIAWRHFGGHRWRYELMPVEGGTLVREQWDPSRMPGRSQRLLSLLGFAKRNRKGMEETLVRLERHLAAAKTTPSS